MKKFLLVSLTTMLCAVTAWGATHEVSTYDELKALVPTFNTNPLAAGDVVKLTSTIESSNSIQWYVYGAFTLDLNGNTLKVNGFTLNGWEGSGEVTITNGRILPYNASTTYALKFSSSAIYDYVIDKVEIGAGSKAALQVSSAKSLTIQGTCSIPSIELGCNFPMTNENTLTTSIINSGYKLNLTNNGTFTFGANTLYSSTTAPTITNNGTIAIEAGAAFTDAAWAVVSSYKNPAHVAEKWAMSSSVLGKKIFASTPTHVAKIGSEEYASFDAAFLDARLSGGSKTIQLLSDANLMRYFSFGSGDLDITVDLNNHTLAMGNNYIWLSPASGTYTQKLTIENGDITCNASSSFQVSPNSGTCTHELTLNNVTLTNTKNQSNAKISQRGIGVETNGKTKLVLKGTTTATVKLTSLYNLNRFDFNNEAQCHVYVFGSTSTTAALTQYIDNNDLLNKLGAENAWWEIQQGFILPAIKDNYTSHITGTVADNTTNVGPTGGQVAHYKITEAGTPVVATVNGVNYYDFFTALDASSETYPAILQTNVYVSGLSALNGQNRYVNLNGHTIEQAGLMLEMNRIENGKLHFLGNGTVTTTAPFYILGSSDASAVDYSVLEIAAGVIVTYDASFENYAIWVAENASNKAYGVRVDLAGTVNSNVGGAYINGKIKTASEHAPIFNITGTLNADHAGIYAAGYGIWHISGTVNGNDAYGIGIKAGKLNVTNNAVIYGGATSEFERVDADGNGMNISGATLQIESNGSYGGNMEISISGNATLSSANKTYAIYEYVDKYDAPTKVNSIAVTGGNFQGGILISQALAAKGGFVSGGTWTEDVMANCAIGYTTSKILGGYGVVEATGVNAEIENTASTTAVLTNSASASSVSDHTSDNVGDNPEVKQTTANNAVVVTENTDVVATEANDVVEVKKVTVEENKTLTVTEGATLTVGSGAVHLGENAKLVVEPGAAMVVDGLVYGATEESFVIESSEEKPSSLLFSPETEFIKEDHPKATFRFFSKGCKKDGKRIWQRFGIPSFDGGTTISWGGGLKTWIYNYIYDEDGGYWNMLNEGAESSGSYIASAAENTPFQCYEMTSNASDVGVEYEFTGNLMGNSNGTLSFVKGWNYYANSYTAPISIYEFFEDIINTYGANVSAEAHIYRAEDDWWDDVSLGAYELHEAMPSQFPAPVQTEIYPMQAFILYLHTGNSAEGEFINYKNHIYDPAIGSGTPAPRRQRSSDITTAVRMTVSGNEYTDDVTLMQADKFSASYDNGYDVFKFMNNSSFNIYATCEENKYGVLATDNMNGARLGFSSATDGTYTLRIEGATGEEYILEDMLTHNQITITTGSEYTFTATAGENDYRFRIVAAPQVTTEITDAYQDIAIWSHNDMLYVADNISDNILLYSVNGQQVMNVPASHEALQTISLNTLQNGAYIVKVGSKTSSIIK